MQVEVVKCQTLMEPKTYDELEAENTWLKGALREPRRERADRAGYEEVDLFIQPVGDADRAAFKRCDQDPRGVKKGGEWV